MRTPGDDILIDLQQRPVDRCTCGASNHAEHSHRRAPKAYRVVNGVSIPNWYEDEETPELDPVSDLLAAALDASMR